MKLKLDFEGFTKYKDEVFEDDRIVPITPTELFVFKSLDSKCPINVLVKGSKVILECNNEEIGEVVENSLTEVSNSKELSCI